MPVFVKCLLCAKAYALLALSTLSLSLDCNFDEGGDCPSHGWCSSSQCSARFEVGLYI